MSDSVILSELRVAARVGVTDAERALPRILLVDLELAVSTAAGRADSLAAAVDYAAVADAAREAAAAREFNLIEAVAEELAAVCLRHPLVASASVRVRKPGALPGCAWAGVSIVRVRGGRPAAGAEGD